MKETTIKDIAHKLSISVSTVSRALADHPDISKKTKVKILAVAEEMEYQPNTIAQSLKTKRTKMIGVIVPEIVHNFFSTAISGIEEVAYQLGYTIIVASSNESLEREIKNAKALVSSRIAGLIVSISQNTNTCEHFNQIIRRNIPVVFFDRVPNDVAAAKVIIDDKRSAYEAVTFLINKGYTRIAHLAGRQNLEICINRYQGYIKALKDNNLEVDNSIVIYGGLHEKDGLSGTDQLLNSNNNPDAIFAVNDPVAIGAIKRIKEAGLKIPNDIAIVGFSNNPISDLIEPGLTTINQPAYEMGRNAAEVLIEQIISGSANNENRLIELKTELIVRDSA